MPTIRLETYIHAPPERCFDLSLDVDLHAQSQAYAHERPIAGVVAGGMHLGDTVTWEAVHFGIKQRLTSQITAYERPSHFTDELVAGIFRRLQHAHIFVSQPPGTLMIDVFTFQAPLGVLGRLAEALFLTRYMTGLLLTWNRFLKQVAESGTDPSPLCRIVTSGHPAHRCMHDATARRWRAAAPGGHKPLRAPCSSCATTPLCFGSPLSNSVRAENSVP